MKKFAAIILALVLALSCCAALAESTYHIYFTTEDLAGTTDMNGFVSGCALTEYNALLLKDDGTYEYTKLLGTVDEEGNVVEGESGVYAMKYVYTGTFTQDGDQVTLNVPDEVVFSEDWGPLVAMGYMSNSEGTGTNGDMVQNYEGVVSDPWDNFGTQVYKFDPATRSNPVAVTVNEDGTFTYNAVASSDDD